MPGERLDAQRVCEWWKVTDTALARLRQKFMSTHGFPPGDNAVTLATDASHLATSALVDLTPIPSDLTTLYWVISEASLPDVDNGYFIHPPDLVARHFTEYGPVPIENEWIVLVFASDGGGHLFAVGSTGRVWKSAAPSWSSGFDLVAATVQEFLELLGRRVANQLCPVQTPNDRSAA